MQYGKSVYVVGIILYSYTCLAAIITAISRGGRSEQMFVNLYLRICSDRQNPGFGFGGSDSDRREKRFRLPGSERLFFANPNLRIPGKNSKKRRRPNIGFQPFRGVQMW